ncbi:MULTISPECIES: MFS transporter [Streptomyces]|uniref:MFS transporter n=1 Tax=Streptomyces TaxID=1883 RepID=UPI0006EB617D|nr:MULTISPECIES: MFS transporter [Streptomyces]
MVFKTLSKSVPEVGEHRRIVVAAAVDTLGVGLFLPLSLYYFTVTTGLPVAGVGAATSAATLSALALAPAAGAATDRFGPRALAVLSNLVTAAGYLAYPFVDGYVGLFLAVFTVMAGDRMYYAAWPTLIAVIAGPGRLDAWYALMQAVGSGSLGLGALASGVFLAGSGPGSLDVLVVFNAVTSLVSAVLALSLPKRHLQGARTPREDAGPRAGFRRVLRDRVFLRLLIGQALIATAWTLPSSFLSLYLVDSLGLPVWWVMATTCLNYLILFAFQLPVTHLVRTQHRTLTMAIGAACFIVTSALFALAAEVGRTAVLAVVIAAIVVYSVGEMLCVPAGNAAVAAHAPEEMRGSYMSVFQMTGTIAFGVAPGMVGALYEADPRLVLLAVGVLVTAGGCAVLSSRRGLTTDR